MKVHRANQTQPGPKVIPLQRLARMIDRGKRHEHAQVMTSWMILSCTSKARLLKPDTVGRYLQQVLKQGNAPADQRRGVPGAVAKSS